MEFGEASATAMSGDMNKTLIVLCAPSVEDKYYASKLTDIIDFMSNFANLVNGKDDVAILVDADTRPLFEGKVPSNILLVANIDDIWIRDFAPVFPSKQIKFKYSPSYLRKQTTQQIDRSFENWFKGKGLVYETKSDIILDGGNVVENVDGTRVIVTDRILRDNPMLTKSTAKDELMELLGVDEVAIIREPPDDTTGHSDGLVMWPTNDKIILLRSNGSIHREIVRELEKSFPDVEIIEIDDHVPNTTWGSYTSAYNCFVNSVVTNNYIYMPIFHDRYDNEMMQLFKSQTDKTIVPISAEKVAMMGGSVRCLSWQVKGSNAMKILQQMRK